MEESIVKKFRKNHLILFLFRYIIHEEEQKSVYIAYLSLRILRHSEWQNKRTYIPTHYQPKGNNLYKEYKAIARRPIDR